jgi:hypothetical protein
MPIDAARLIRGAQERRRTIGIIDDPTHFYGMLVGGQDKPASWRSYLNLSATGSDYFMFVDNGTTPFIQDTYPAFYITADGSILLQGNLTAYGTVRSPILQVYDVVNHPAFGASVAQLTGDTLIRRLWSHDDWTGNITTVGFTDSLNATNIFEGELYTTSAANMASTSGDRAGVPASAVLHVGNYTAMIGGGSTQDTDTWDSSDTNEPTTTISFTHTEGTDSDEIASGSRMLKNVDTGSGAADVDGIYTLTLQVEHDCTDYTEGLPFPDGAIFQTTVTVEYNTYNGGWDGWEDGEVRVYSYLADAGQGFGTFVIPQYVGDTTHTDVQFRIKHASTLTLGANDTNGGTIYSQVHVFDEEAGSWPGQAYDITWFYETGSGTPQSRRGVVFGAQTSRPHVSLEPLGTTPASGIRGDVVYVYDTAPDPDVNSLFVHNGTGWQDLLTAVSAGLGDLTDVTITTPAEGDYVRYNNASTWVNVTVAQLITDIAPVLADGSAPLTAAWDAGSWQIRAETFQSDIATGTAPFTVASTTVVANLNADLVDGIEGTVFARTDQSNQWTGSTQNMEDSSEASALETTIDSPAWLFTSKYWDGGASQDQQWSVWAVQPSAADNVSYLQIQDPDNNQNFRFYDSGATVLPGTLAWGGGAAITDSDAMVVNPIAADFDPDGDSTYDLGGTGAVWAEVWVDQIRSDGTITINAGGDIIISDDLRSSGDSTHDLGQSGNVFAQVWADDWRSDNTMEWYVSGTLRMSMSTSLITLTNTDLRLGTNVGLQFGASTPELRRATSPTRVQVDYGTSVDTDLASVVISNGADASSPANYPHGSFWCRYN